MVNWLYRLIPSDRLRIYLIMGEQLSSRYPDEFHWFPFLKNFSRWAASIVPGKTPLSDETPWMTFSAIDFFRRALRREMRVFEYGTGGSTLFFARCTQSVVSIEHDEKWAAQVDTELKKRHITNVTLQFIPPQLTKSREENSYLSSDFPEHSFIDYVTAIAEFPDEYFDLVVVDGRARSACMAAAREKVKRGGWLVLDNAERPEYEEAQALIRQAGWQETSFPDAAPHLPETSLTRIWQRTA